MNSHILHIVLLAVGLVGLAFSLAMATGPGVRDAGLKLTRALANGAATVTSTAIDTGVSSNQSYQPGNVEYLLTAPAQTTAQMPDAKTMKYDICYSANADLSSPTTYITAAITQTGAGGVGCAAATFRFRLPSDAPRYLFFKATGSASGDSTGVSATLDVFA